MNANKPIIIQQFKFNIREEVRAIGPETLRKFMVNALERARQFEANIGHDLKDIIFKHNENIIPNYNPNLNKCQH